MTSNEENLASLELAQELLRAYGTWQQQHPDATNETILNGIVDGAARLIFILVKHGAKPGASQQAIDEILGFIRQDLILREL